MKNLSLLVLGCFIINLGAFAQQITVGEYFFDTDPGQGNATVFSFAAADSVNTTTNIDVSSLSPGHHHLGLRTKNSSGEWSHYEMRLFYVIEAGEAVASQSELQKGEYFFDTDPGQGNGIAFSFTAADSVNTTTNVDVTGLSPGHHHLGLRTKNSTGEWSHYEMRMFYVIEEGEAVADQPLLTAGEYFFDTDPGQGNGTAISFSATDSVSMVASIPVSSLNSGFHNLFVRTKNNVGKWSHYEGRMFYIIEAGEAVADQPSLVSGEYYFDTDPGFGSGTAISFSTADSVNMAVNISTNGLASGTHNVFLRTKNANGEWSHYEGREFEICGSVIQGTASIVLQSGNAVICAGQNNTFEATLVNEGTTPQYVWQLNGSVVSGNASFSVPSSLQTGDELTLAVISSDACVDPNPLRDTLDVVVIDTVFTTEAITICDGTSYLLPNGTTVSTGGEYISYLSAVNTCDSVVTTNLTVEICTGLDEMEATNFLLYPNPNKGQFSIEGGSTSYSIEIYNAVGQLVLSQRAVQERSQLNLQQQPSGIYHVSVIANGQVSRFKVLKY